NPGAGNSGGAGTTIGLDHIAVQHNRVFAECFGIHNGTQAASNQPRNLLGATRDFTTHRFACTALSGGSRQHGVFGGHPATIMALKKEHDSFRNHRGSYDCSGTKTDKRGTLCMCCLSSFVADITKVGCGSVSSTTGQTILS